MNGFITESTSKITDGFGSTLKLLLITIVAPWIFYPFTQIIGHTGEIICCVLFGGLSLFYLYKTFSMNSNESQQAGYGMAAGVFLWQAVRNIVFIEDLGVFRGNGFLYWGLLALVIVLLWSKLPTGVRLFLMTIMMCWVGKLYMNSSVYYASWPKILATVHPYIRYLGIGGMLFSIWWIVRRSANVVERKYAALMLFFSIMLTFLLF